MHFDRRHFLQAAAALATAPALAKAPLAGSQAPSVHRLQLGEFEVTSVLDGFLPINPELLNAPKDEVEKMLQAEGLAYGPLRTPVNTFLVNTGEKLVLIDTGGARMIGPGGGRLVAALQAAGVTPDMVDEVYITHMHGDHLHGAVTPEGTALFTNAVLRINRNDVDFWANPEVEAAAPADQKGRFVAAKRAKAAYGGRLQAFEPGEELVRGIRSVAAHGHTPGHTCYLVTSGSAKLMAVGDLVHVPQVQFPRPEITIAFDSHQPTAARSRGTIFDRIVAENMLMAAVHLPFPGIGQLRRSGSAYSYVPITWRLF